MRVKLSTREKFLTRGLPLLFFGLALAARFFGPAWAFEILLLAGVTAAWILVGDLHRRSSKEYRQIRNSFAQTDTLTSLLQTIDLTAPLPKGRGWAASPDFLAHLAGIIKRERPKVIVEVGSGLSTLISGYCLKRLGAGKVISLDHGADFARRSRDNVQLHELDDFVSVFHAPLIRYEIEGKSWLWYDMESLKNVEAIDLLIVDGPPGDVQHLARFPALPLLHHKLRKGGIMLMDDADRVYETEIVGLWKRQFKDMEFEYIPLEKGAYVLKKI